MAKAKRKITKEELHQDELAESLYGIRDWFVENWVRMAIYVVLALSAVIAFNVYQASRRRIETDTSRILTSASEIFNQLPGMLNEEERTLRLESTIDALGDLIERYTDSESARVALYMQGNCYYYMDELDKAGEAYTEYIRQAPSAIDRARGEIALGYTFENQYFLGGDDRRKLDEAAVHYRLALDEAPEGSYLYYYALLNEARLLELTFNDEEAMAIYERIMAERKPPRSDVLNLDEDDPENAFSGGMTAFVQSQFRQRLEPLSFYATAKLRSDRLAATSLILPPEDLAEPAAPPSAPGE